MLGKSTLRQTAMPDSQTADALKDAVARLDAAKCGSIAETLRLVNGMRYVEIRDLVVSVTGIDPREWEALLLESESE